MAKFLALTVSLIFVFREGYLRLFRTKETRERDLQIYSDETVKKFRPPNCSNWELKEPVMRIEGFIMILLAIFTAIGFILSYFQEP